MQDLKTARRLKKMTQQDLSDLTGLSQPHLAEIEAGEMLPTRRTCQRVERILGSEINWLATYSADRSHIGYVLRELMNPEQPGMSGRILHARQYLRALETLKP